MQYSMIAWLRKSFHQHAEKDLSQPWQIEVNGREFYLQEIHTDFLLGREVMIPGSEQVLIPLTAIKEIRV